MYVRFEKYSLNCSFWGNNAVVGLVESVAKGTAPGRECLRDMGSISLYWLTNFQPFAETHLV